MIDVEIELDDIRDLLVAPAADPRAVGEARLMGEAGVRRVARALSRNWFRHTGGPDAKPDPGRRTGEPLRLVIRVPAEQAAVSGLREETRKALGRYCEVAARDADCEVGSLRRQGRRSLHIGLVLLVIAVGLSTLFARLFAGTFLLGTVLVEGFTIIGWVSLWAPTERLLLDPLPLLQQARVYRALATAELVIRARA